MRFLRHLRDELSKPVSALSLGLFRLLFGVILLLSCDKVYNDKEWSWDMVVQSQTYFLKYRLFTWLPEPGAEFVGFHLPDMKMVSYAMRASAVLIIAGVAVRPAAVVYLLLYAFAVLAEASLYNNHYYFTMLMVIVLCVTDTGRCLSLAQLWFMFFRRSSVDMQVGLWQIQLFRFQVAVCYMFGGIAKINQDWLLHCQPLRTWVHSGNLDLTWLDSLGSWGSLLATWMLSDWRATCYMSWAGCLIDLMGSFFLFGWHPFRRADWLLRLFAAAALLAFHSLNSKMFNIGVFPYMMIVTIVLALPPVSLQWGQRYETQQPSQLSRSEQEDGSISSNRKKRGIKKTKLGITPDSQPPKPGPWLFMTIFVLYNVLMPLRHHFIEGPVETTREGNEFAWRMKLFNSGYNTTESRFMVHVDGEHNFNATIDQTSRFVSSRQRLLCARSPEYFVQCADFLARDLEKRHGVERARIKIFGHLVLSYNYRPFIAIVDSTVDLLRCPTPLLGHASWTLLPPAGYFDKAPAKPRTKKVKANAASAGRADL